VNIRKAVRTLARFSEQRHTGLLPRQAKHFVPLKDILSIVLCWWHLKCAPGDTVLEGLEKEAREAKKGLWADPQPVPPPRLARAFTPSTRSSTIGLNRDRIEPLQPA